MNDLLRQEVRLIEHYLSGFQTSRPPRVGLGTKGGTLWIRNLPLPDGLRPDHLDMVLDVSGFPQEPAKGMYLLITPENRALVDQLKLRFNVFQNNAAHGAKPIEGFEWICFGYLSGWSYNIRAPHKGDNLAKMLMEFWRALQEGRGTS